MSALKKIPAVTHRVSEDTILRYAELSGDYNPIHVDHEFATATRFGSVIAHGPVALQAIFESITSWLGLDSLPPSVNLEAFFRSPVVPGDSVTSRVDGTLIHAGSVVLSMSAVNQRDEVVIEAVAELPRYLAPTTG
jgi:acyl dehydratase